MAPKTKWIEGAAAQDPLEVVARRALRGRLDLVWLYLPRAADGPRKELENVHQLRVATRRAMAAMEVFESLLPPRRADWLVRKLKEIRQAAGAARDLDVFQQRLSERLKKNDDSRYAPLLRLLRDAREAAQEPIEAICDKLRNKRYSQRVSAVVKRVRLREDSFVLNHPTFGVAARISLRQYVDDFFAASRRDLHDYEALHAFRIEGKRLRYAMEIFAGAFEPWFRKDLYKLLEALQERLGEVNDHATAIERLKGWLAECENTELARCLQSLLAEERAAIEKCRGQVLDWWNAQHRSELRAGFARALAPPEIFVAELACEDKCG